MAPQSLRSVREALGLTATELAAAAACPVEVLLRAEFGIAVPHDEGVRARLARAYGLGPREYVLLALDAAERAAS